MVADGKSRYGERVRYGTDGTAVTITIRENAIKKTFGKSFTIPLNIDFLKNSAFPQGYKEDLIVRLELNSSMS